MTDETKQVKVNGSFGKCPHTSFGYPQDPAPGRRPQTTHPRNFCWETWTGKNGYGYPTPPLLHPLATRTRFPERLGFCGLAYRRVSETSVGLHWCGRREHIHRLDAHRSEIHCGCNHRATEIQKGEIRRGPRVPGSLSRAAERRAAHGAAGVAA